MNIPCEYLFDYYVTFNTIISAKCTAKLEDLELNTYLCKWIMSFLTSRLHSVKMVVASPPHHLWTQEPHRAAFSHLYFLFIQDCVDEPKVDEKVYRDEVRALSEWYNVSNFCFNISKAREMIMDGRRLQRDGHAPLCIIEATVEQVKNIKFLSMLHWLDQVLSHNDNGEICLSAAAAFPSQHQILQMYNREHSNWMHYCLFWQLLRVYKLLQWVMRMAELICNKPWTLHDTFIHNVWGWFSHYSFSHFHSYLLYNPHPYSHTLVTLLMSQRNPGQSLKLSLKLSYPCCNISKGIGHYANMALFKCAVIYDFFYSIYITTSNLL